MELAARLPVKCKVQGHTTKRLLRETFADILPPALCSRPKMGFGVPLGEWFRGPLREAAQERLLSAGACSAAVLERTAVERLLAEHASAKIDHGKRIWALLMLETWMQVVAVGENRTKRSLE